MRVLKIHTKSNIISLIIILLFSLNIVSAQNNSILDTTLSYKSKDLKLSQVLSELGNKVGYSFSYNPDLLASYRVVKAKFTETSLNEILNTLINDSTLVFKVIDKQIIITKDNKINKLSFIHTVEGSTVNFLRIRGKIIDQRSGAPLSFSNVAIKNKALGTISNEQGEFNLTLSSSFISDTIVFSYLGYRNAYIAIKELAIRNNKIYLLKENYRIKEVVIKNYNANEILKNAVNDIKNNYYTDPYQITAFYREMVKKESDLVAISEAVLDVYKSPYLGTYSDQIKLIKGRRDEFYSNNDTIALKLKAGLHTSLYLDVVKNPPYFLQEKFFHLFSYYVEKISKYNDQSVYEIKFKPKYYIEENSFEGIIYIGTEDLSIVALDFKITENALQKMGRELIVRKAFRTKVKTVEAHYQVNYRKVDGKYYLNFATGELEFKVRRKKSLFSKDFRTSFEFVSNDYKIKDVKRHNRSDLISKYKVFLDAQYEYDYKYWALYNYISPNKSLEDALIDIQKKINNL